MHVRLAFGSASFVLAALIGVCTSGCDGGGGGGGGGAASAVPTSDPATTQAAAAGGNGNGNGNAYGSGGNPSSGGSTTTTDTSSGGTTTGSTGGTTTTDTSGGTTTGSTGGTTTGGTSTGGTSTGGTSTGGTSTGGSTGGATPTALDISVPSLGMNLNAVSYYTPEWVFTDVMKASMVGSTTQWDLLNPNGLALPSFDAAGYPVGLGSGQVASTIMLRSIGGHYPGGTYTVRFDGDGALALSFDAKATFDHDGSGTAQFTAPVTPTSAGIQVRITRSNPSNHVRNIRVLQPGFESASSPFHPTFKSRLGAFGVLRFMDWGQTNDSTLKEWSQRKLPTYRTQHKGGVAYEHMLDLSNELGKHPWICVPHQASDDFVRKLATLIRDRMKPGLKVFIEYSNEVWNGGFGQYSWVNSVAAAQGIPWYVQYARRSSQIFAIFESVFGGRERLVRVVGSQSANSWLAQQIVNNLTGTADAVAIAPYIGGALGHPNNLATTKAMSVSQVLDAVAADIEKVRLQVRANKAVAAGKGMKLIAYEGGQHLAAGGAAVDDPTLTNLLTAANRDARMKTIYKDYLAMWKQEGGGLFVHFSYCYVPQKWGNWGCLEWQDQTGAPKFDALIEVSNLWR